jgi:D-alanyl-D-alanine dipeptidase
VVGPDNQPLDFFSPFEMTDPRAAPAFQKGLSPDAERNRAKLPKAKLVAAQTNYPNEWRHWSYRDQDWAYRGGHETAFYGAIRPKGLTDADLEFSVHETPGF